MLTLDGAAGEGGGQILRTALALSIVTGTPFRMIDVRARRPKPGLQRQHLTAVRAAAAISDADVEGDEVHSTALVFRPGRVRPGTWRFDIGTAGSTNLVLQTVLPPLVRADRPSDVTIDGGTANVAAPSTPFLQRAFAPLLARTGPRLDLELRRWGFYPAGGGRIVAHISPGPPAPLSLLERGPVRAMRATAVVSGLHPRARIPERELAVLRERFPLAAEEIVEVERPIGPGNMVWLEVETEGATEVFAGHGQRGVPAETVAASVADEAEDWLRHDVPVACHLADQLLVPLALGAGGEYRTLAPSLHTTTNADVVRRFLDVDIGLHDEGEGRWRVAVRV